MVLMSAPVILGLGYPCGPRLLCHPLLAPTRLFVHRQGFAAPPSAEQGPCKLCEPAALGGGGTKGSCLLFTRSWPLVLIHDFQNKLEHLFCLIFKR